LLGPRLEPNGGSLVGFYGRDGLAAEVGTSPEGSGFSGMVFTYVVRSEARFDEIIADAEKAGVGRDRVLCTLAPVLDDLLPIRQPA
jgi:hypothetical protein